MRPITPLRYISPGGMTPPGTPPSMEGLRPPISPPREDAAKTAAPPALWLGLRPLWLLLAGSAKTALPCAVAGVKAPVVAAKHG